MDTKYGMEVNKENFYSYLITLKNKIYKLLPLREEKLEWRKYLETILIEISGLNKLFNNTVNLISLLSKLECLFDLEEFVLYRKTIFECLNIVENISRELL